MRGRALHGAERDGERGAGAVGGYCCDEGIGAAREVWGGLDTIGSKYCFGRKTWMRRPTNSRVLRGLSSPPGIFRGLKSGRRDEDVREGAFFLMGAVHRGGVGKVHL